MKNQFSITQAAFSTRGRAKTRLLSVGMTNTHISNEEIMVVCPRIAETNAAALPCEVDRVKFGTSLIDDLGAQSVDFLDFVFRPEQVAVAVSKPS